MCNSYNEQFSVHRPSDCLKMAEISEEPDPLNATDNPQRSFVKTLFGTPDHNYQGLKRYGSVLLGAEIGASVGWFSLLLSPTLTTRELIENKKKWALGRVITGTAIGGLSGALYILTVQQVCKLRGDKDDYFNHFCGSFAAAAPLALYNSSVKAFFRLGFYGGLLFVMAKYAYSSDNVGYKDVILQRDVLCANARYPDLFVQVESIERRNRWK